MERRAWAGKEAAMKKMLFVYNPHAGKEAIKAKLSDVLEVFMEAGYEVTIYATKQRLDGTRIVKSRGEDFDLVVCSGGDGTLNEISDGLMALETRPPCGYIPAGTVNDFASSLNIPKNVILAAHNVVEGVEFPYDIGSLNGDYYNYVAAFGAFTEVSYETPQTSKNMLGKLAYFLDGVKRLPTLKSYYMTAEYEGNRLEGEFIYGMVSNSYSVGGFKGLTGKNVVLDDGLFEVVLIRQPKNVADLHFIINSLLTGEMAEQYISTFQTSRVVLTSDVDVAWTLDGEYGGKHTTAIIENHQRAIRYIAAKESEELKV